MQAKFGTAGNSDSFYAQGFKDTYKMPKWLFDMGLDAYEYQCGNGVRVGEGAAKKIGEEMGKYKIELSIHSPYYINLATSDDENRLKSIGYIMQTMKVAKHMGATRVVVHSGSLGKMTRQEALEFAKLTLSLAQKEADANGYSNIHICPETMGKINQLGDLDEVMELCSLDDRLIPTIDFGHLNARTQGAYKQISDFEKIFSTIENKLGLDRLKLFHSHFSKIEYTKGGEKKHLTFDDTIYGPNFEPVGELIYKKGLTPTIICESRGTQAEDALVMKNIYKAHF